MSKSTRTHGAATAPKKQTVTADEALAWLESRGKQKNIVGLARFGIAATNPFGVTVGEIRDYAKKVGKDHELAEKLWASGRYEARLLAAFVDDPAQVTVGQMNQWSDEFDNWAVVDTVCFHLFDRVSPRWKVISLWAKAKPEFKKRAAFALLWSLSVHDKEAPDGNFLKCFPWIERGAEDDRNFVKKAVNMALRAIGKRNRALHASAVETAKRLANSHIPSARWVGSHALRELQSAAVRKQLGD